MIERTEVFIVENIPIIKNKGYKEYIQIYKTILSICLFNLFLNLIHQVIGWGDGDESVR